MLICYDKYPTIHLINNRSQVQDMEQTTVTLREKDQEVVESKALNLSKFLRKKLEEEFPDKYND